MKVLTTAGLTKLIQLCKSAFVHKTDVVETQTVTLATVATSGSYNDLSDKPTIPTGTVKSVNNISPDSNGNVTINALQNTATHATSLTILGTPATQDQNVNIGIDSSCSSYGGTALGKNSISSGAYSTAIGCSTKGYGQYSIEVGYGARVDSDCTRGIAIGNSARVSAYGAIQIGSHATNSEAGTMYVGLLTSGYQATNYKLLGSTGLIPPERHASVSSTAGDYYAKITVDSQGKATSSWGPAPTPSIDWTSITGYDATKKQILVNDQGTVKWVTAGYIE